MTLKNKIKLWLFFILALVIGVGYLVLGVESVQKKLYDNKADLVGTNRTITFYSPMDANVVATYSDRDTRYEVNQNGIISVWLGSQNKKVHSNLNFIIEDK